MTLNLKKPLTLLTFAVTSLLSLPGFTASVSFSEDFSGSVLPEDRFEVQAAGESAITVADGWVRMTAVAADEAVVNTRLKLVGQTDYFEADVLVSSETISSGTGRGRVQMAGILYNDTATGVSGDFTGDVWAGISLGKDFDDSLWIFACLERSDDADFEAMSSLLFNEAGNECVHLAPPLQPEFDKPVTMRIELDRESGKVLFSVNDETIEYIINTPIFDSANESKEIKARREAGAGTTVIYVDNVKTAENPDAEDSASETESGVTEADSGDDAASSSVGAAGPGLFLLAFLYRLRRRTGRLSA